MRGTTLSANRSAIAMRYLTGIVACSEFCEITSCRRTRGTGLQHLSMPVKKIEGVYLEKSRYLSEQSIPLLHT